MKQCRKCKNWKALDEFCRHSETTDGRGSYCKPCNNAARRAIAKANPEREREHDRKRRRTPDRIAYNVVECRKRRFMKRKAKERAAGIFGNESGSRAKY